MEIIVVILFLVLPKSIRETKREIDRDNGHNVNANGRVIVRSFVCFATEQKKKKEAASGEIEREKYPYMYCCFIMCA